MRHMDYDTVYVVKISGQPYYKIGYTRNLTRRLYNIEQGLPFYVELVTYYRSKTALDFERHLKMLFKTKRVKGEWFKLDDSDIKKIQSAFELSPLDSTMLKILHAS